MPHMTISEVWTIGNSLAEGELEIQDEELRKYLDDYDPSREFTVVLMRSNSKAVYLGLRPDIGWMADLGTRTNISPMHPIKRMKCR